MSEHKLINTYNELMGHVYEAMDDTLHSLADALDIAKEKTSALGGHTQEELNKIANFVSRDVKHHAATIPVNQVNSLSEWLKFDINLIENFALDTFLNIADKTRVQLSSLEMDAQLYHPYQTGDAASPGTFVCDQCGKQIAFKSTCIIPECPDCHAKQFSRL